MNSQRFTIAYHRLRPSIGLLVASILIVTVWGFLLPWLSTRAVVSERLKFLEANKVDPSAMYYTDLDVMEEILYRQERAAENHRVSRSH